MNEDQFRDRIVRPRLEARGALVALYPKTRYAQAGVSDLLVCYRGRFIAIELKHPTDTKYKETALQLDFLRRVRSAQGHSIVARSWEPIEALLDMIDAASGAGITF